MRCDLCGGNHTTFECWKRSNPVPEPARPASAEFASTTGANRGSLHAVVGRFRLLEHGDLIGEGDEFLDDDCETWMPLPEVWWGTTKCNYLMLKPVRSKAPSEAPSEKLTD